MSFCLNVPVPPRSNCCRAQIPLADVPVEPKLRPAGAPPSTVLAARADGSDGADRPPRARCPSCGQPCDFYW